MAQEPTPETKQVSVILGPYAGNRLTMPTAEADAAVSAHWALDPTSTEPYPGHPPLSAEEREAAVNAATEWAHVQWNVQSPAEPKDGTETPPAPRRRAMQAETDPNYKTR